MIHSPKIFKILETAPLFLGIPTQLLARHLGKSRLQPLGSDQVLLVPGTSNNTIYLILSGRLRVQSKDSDAEPIAVLGEGECVGEMSMLGDAPVSAYVIADSDCQLLAVDHAVIWELINSSHAAASNMLNILTSRIRSTNELAAESLEQHQGFSGDSMVDELTGLYNQHSTRKKFERLLQRSQKGNKPCCLLTLEIDHIDEYTVKHGQLGGDQAQRDVAYVVLNNIRPEDHAGRHNGEKFAVFLSDTSLSDARIATERLNTCISLSSVVLPSGDALPPITVSTGISQARPDDTVDELFARTDLALQLAKDSGGDCIKSSQ